MTRMKGTFAGMTLLLLAALMPACATAPPQASVQVQNVFAKKGDTIHLFSGGSKVAQEEFCINALVPIYRYEGRYSTVGSTGIQRQEVGKIKITRDMGDYYLEGIVIEGNIKNGDIAVQPQSGCLVRLPEREER